MAVFLSDEWIAEMNAAAATVAAGDAADLTVQQVVRGPGGDRAYLFRIRGGKVSVEAGVDPGAQVRLTEDRDTAAAIARGELTTQAALVSGRIRVAADMPALLAALGVLAGLGDAFAAVRAATTY